MEEILARHARPDLTEELLTHLRGRFPNTVPKPTDSDREVWMSVGRQAVIAHLERLLAERDNPPAPPEPSRPSVAERILSVLRRP